MACSVPAGACLCASTKAINVLNFRSSKEVHAMVISPRVAFGHEPSIPSRRGQPSAFYLQAMCPILFKSQTIAKKAAMHHEKAAHHHGKPQK
jgi:hypothetical protein